MIDVDVILWIFIASKASIMLGQLVALVVLALIANWMIKRSIKQATGQFLGAIGDAEEPQDSEKALREKLRKEFHRQGNRGMPSKPAVALQQGYEDGLKIGKLRGQLEVLSSLRELLVKKKKEANVKLNELITELREMDRAERETEGVLESNEFHRTACVERITLVKELLAELDRKEKVTK